MAISLGIYPTFSDKPIFSFKKSLEPLSQYWGSDTTDAEEHILGDVSPCLFSSREHLEGWEELKKNSGCLR